MDNVVIVRYKDIGTTNALQEHRDILNQNGAVWCAWWGSISEFLPKKEKIEEIRKASNNEGVIFWLLNSKTKEIHEVVVSDIKFSSKPQIGKIRCPDKNLTPSYYKDNMYPLWFKITKISEKPLEGTITQNYYYEFFDAYRTCNEDNFCNYDHKCVKSVEQLLRQPRSIFFINKYLPNTNKEDIEFENEILRTRKERFSSKHYIIDSNNILLLSDLHFADCDMPEEIIGTTPTLEKSILDACNKQNFDNFASVIIAGDVADKSNKNGYIRAEAFIYNIVNSAKIPKDTIVMVPGNHDIAYSNEKLTELFYASEESKKEYCKLFNNVFDCECEASASFSMGRKLLLKNRLSVEILGLNSIPYAQTSELCGFGEITHEQLENGAKNMGWTKNQKGYSFRIIVFHHPLFPIGCVNQNISTEKTKNRMQEICSDFADILSFIDDYKVDLVITGHSHENGFLQFKSETGDLTTWIGLGTANSKNIGDNVKQSFAILDFNETNRIRLHIFKTNDSTKTKSFERCLPHTSEIRLRNE